MLTAEEIIQCLQLEPHPCEGGFFRETYRARFSIPASALPSEYSGDRCASTAIYYLLTPGTFSEMHRLPTDEVFHFYLGDAVEMLQLQPGWPRRSDSLGQRFGGGRAAAGVGARRHLAGVAVGARW